MVRFSVPASSIAGQYLSGKRKDSGFQQVPLRIATAVSSWEPVRTLDITARFHLVGKFIVTGVFGILENRHIDQWHLEKPNNSKAQPQFGKTGKYKDDSGDWHIDARSTLTQKPVADSSFQSSDLYRRLRISRSLAQTNEAKFGAIKAAWISMSRS